MKQVLFIRHAKSNWSNNSITDHDRTLSDRGEENALLMAKRFKKNNIFPELFITSSATRALTTCKIIKNELGNTLDMIINSKIYHHGHEGILKSIESADNNVNFIAIFGHNPTMHTIANQISIQPIYKFPTCAAILSSCNIDKWEDFHFNAIDFLMYDFPKNNGSR